MNYTTKITIRNGGEIEGHIEDIKGPSCRGLLSWLENLGPVKERGATRDMNKTEEENTEEKVVLR